MWTLLCKPKNHAQRENSIADRQLSGYFVSFWTGGLRRFWFLSLQSPEVVRAEH